MGKQVKDRDWVVVGSNPKEMVELGFKPVGKDFPVFLHPDSKEEYALARTERKTAQGYHGFEFFCEPDTTLEQDLGRRDLTMNAIAMDQSGNIIDPFGGERDIGNKVIRHVSDAFSEDPVRVLRVARFAARFPDFNISKDTQRLMNKMVINGEVDSLVAERVWQETHQALQEVHCSRFLNALRGCGALQRILPEIDNLFGVPQTEKYHPEIDTGIHTLMSLDVVTRINDDPMVRFAVMLHDLGKALTPSAELPGHRGHERRGLKPINMLCDRLGVPSQYREFALKVCEYHLHCHRIAELKPTTVLKVLEAFDGFRKPELIPKFAMCCDADRRGRTGRENDIGGQTEILLEMHRSALDVNQSLIAKQVTQRLQDEGNPGKMIKQEIRKKRIAAISEVKGKYTLE